MSLHSQDITIDELSMELDDAARRTGAFLSFGFGVGFLIFRNRNDIWSLSRGLWNCEPFAKTLKHGQSQITEEKLTSGLSQSCTFGLVVPNGDESPEPETNRDRRYTYMRTRLPIPAIPVGIPRNYVTVCLLSLSFAVRPSFIHK